MIITLKVIFIVLMMMITEMMMTTIITMITVMTIIIMMMTMYISWVFRSAELPAPSCVFACETIHHPLAM
jgi:hypothetical protein